MSELAELQEWMARLLVRRRALDKDPNIVDQAKERVTGNDRLLPVQQVEIYREQFWLRHTASLLEDFPGVAGVVGQADWERLVEEYLAAHPPTGYSLRDLGEHFPAFVEAATFIDHHELCVDMARLEWAYVEAFDAPDAPRLDAEKLAAIPEPAWEHARVLLDPALRLVRVSYPVGTLRRQLRDAKPGVHVPIPEREPQNLVVYRALRNLFWHHVGNGAFALLSALKDGLPLVAAAERAIAEAPDDGQAIEVSIGGWFQDWGSRGWIVDVDVE